MKETNDIKIVGKQKFRDSDMLRVTLDLSQLTWLILQNEIKSKSFGNITDVSEKATKLLKDHF